MAKQKFRCEGVLRKTGQKVAVEVSAESKEMALKMADQHGVTVERIGLAGAAAKPAQPQPSRPRQKPQSADEPLGENDEDVDGLLDSANADPFDLAGASPLAQPAVPSMKACPYCGEPILAVAIKCKHCGSVLPVKEKKGRQSAPAAPPTSRRRKLLIFAGAAIAVSAISSWAVWHFLLEPLLSAVTPSLPQPATAPPPVATQPPPRAPAPSAEEIAFAARLVAFLDASDQTAKTLEEPSGPSAETKQHDALTAMIASFSGIAQPPAGAAWAAEAAQDASGLMQAATTAIEATSVNELLKGLNQPADAAKVARGYRDAARRMREIAAAVRSKIPPGCLPKRPL